MENKNWGFNTYAEKINGRLAMLAFLMLFLFELLTNKKITDF